MARGLSEGFLFNSSVPFLNFSKLNPRFSLYTRDHGIVPRSGYHRYQSSRLHGRMIMDIAKTGAGGIVVAAGFLLDTIGGLDTPMDMVKTLL